VKFGAPPQLEGETVQMAPLVDIVFLTLVFFMVTSVYANLESEVGITLPTANSAVMDERAQGEIFINVRESGEVVLNDREVTLPELEQILVRVSTHFPGGEVIIRGDTNARHGRMIEILDACKKADIQNISFAAMQPETDAGSAP
jgi:biopolymer transport protein ExbD